MTMYHWNNSKAFAQYGSGHIVVSANSIEEASMKVRLEAEKFIQKDRGHWDQEDIDDFLNKLNLDLMETPEYVDNGVIFIEGSE